MLPHTTFCPQRHESSALHRPSILLFDNALCEDFHQASPYKTMQNCSPKNLEGSAPADRQGQGMGRRLD